MFPLIRAGTFLFKTLACRNKIQQATVLDTKRSAGEEGIT